MGDLNKLDNPGNSGTDDIEAISQEIAEMAETDLSYPFRVFVKALVNSGIGDEATDKVLNALKDRIRAYHNNEGI